MPSLQNVQYALDQARKAMGPGHYELAGKPITCPHCQNDIFEAGDAQLNTSTMSFFNLDWLNKSVTVLVCTACGQIQWFSKRPDKKIASSNSKSEANLAEKL